ncbi:unnamed protein product [Cladocopium goreaui]|uniref:Uncharacterized protein n=1 Tax=Cladocopium goreaui TaxID=2562237 RepID=A0A9P1FTF3_9DINO|nr:unnamed protein product [Cladocopium goreaui]
MGSGASSRSDIQEVDALTGVQPEPRLPKKKYKIKWDRNDMMKRKKEAAKVAKATSEPPSRRSQISEGETTVRSLSQSQLGSILEEMDDEAALEAGIDHPFCPQNDSESGRGMSQGRNTLS